jgi:tRNA threonylcarbamoyladenosine biosynthesis protein TsaB
VILAIDCSSDRLSVAVRDGRGRTATRTMVGARRHARFLAPLALEALEELYGSPAELEGLALADGPGSFTGLRVGAAFVKAVSRARGLPVWSASTLGLRAWHARPQAGTRVVAGVGSALRGELYVAVYRLAGPGEPGCPASTELLPPMVLAKGEPIPAHEPIDVVVGDVAIETVGKWAWGPSPTFVGPPEGSPSAMALLDLVVAGAALRVDPVGAWEPEYGRPAEAQARWERAHGRPIDSSHPA